MLDTLGFVDAVRGLPEQLADAHAATRDALAGAALPAAADITSIAVLGMGGSGISGDVLAAAASGDLCLPVSVHKQIRTPAYIGPRTLVFAVSYSGDTEETVSMARGAIEGPECTCGSIAPTRMASMRASMSASMSASTMGKRNQSASTVSKYKARTTRAMAVTSAVSRWFGVAARRTVLGATWLRSRPARPEWPSPARSRSSQPQPAGRRR